MEPITVDVTQNNPYGVLKPESSISFKGFISFLEKRAEQEQTIKKFFFSQILEKLKSNPAFSEEIPLAEIAQYKEELSLIYGMLMPPIADEKEVYWAMSAPASPVVFFGTSGFYSLLTDELTNEPKCELIQDQEASYRQKTQTLYAFILEKLYHLPPAHHPDIILSLKDEQSGLQKHYRAHIDNRFCEVYAKGPLPELDLDWVRNELNDPGSYAKLGEMLPQSLFRFEGFSLITLTDVTAEHAVENIKNTILDRASFDPRTYFNRVTDSLKMLVEDPHIDFGQMALLRVNNKLVFDRNSVLFSKLMSIATDSDMAEHTYLQMADQYFQNPKILLLRDLDAVDKEKQDFVRILKDDGVKAYALLPVYYENQVVGVLEVYSKQHTGVDEKLLAKLDIALPWIAQIMKNYRDEFNVQIDSVIREKFTSLQPAVQWRFRESAWHYLRDKALNPADAAIESIQFRNVFPLYGAIDIRNSTSERNMALREDLRLQFDFLVETFTVLKQKMGFGLADEMIYKCRKWVSEIFDDNTDNDEVKVRDFLENEVHPFLLHFKNESEQRYGQVAPDAGELVLRDKIDQYFAMIDETSGAAFANRRALEASMQKINASVNLYLDLFRTEIQQVYPSYFEKFRTDGIEYDIYIGQSIEPEKRFSELYLKNIRLWQLTAMAAIARITHSLVPQMEKPLETTQLIFIHSAPIDISFRDDERRFDVEGAYNIRYQVIKKRIDKVRIKGTGERLTQPGKIALVYFNSRSAEEYVGYIHYLQEKNTLLNDLEMLDLEELQGVTGLKALRIGINLDSDWEQ